MTFAPVSSKSGTIFIEAPCGVAVNMMSASNSLGFLFLNTKSVPLMCGWTLWTGVPSNCLEVMSTISTSGWAERSLINSPPVYPLPPTIATLTIFTPWFSCFFVVLNNYQFYYFLSFYYQSSLITLLQSKFFSSNSECLILLIILQVLSSSPFL